jgi:hypothetical protein
MPAELLVLTIIKALAELAGLFLLGQGLLYVLAGEKRDGNYFYQLLRALTKPVVRGTRVITPKFVLDRHIPFVAVLVLFWIWLAVLLGMAQVCNSKGLDCKALKQSAALVSAMG